MPDAADPMLEAAPLRASDGVTLRRWTLDDAEPLFRLVDENRAFLGEWLTWVDTIRSTVEEAGFIAQAQQHYSERSSLQLALEIRGQLAGSIGLSAISAQNRQAEIGYWLAEGFTGQGHATAACRGLIAHAFGPLGLHRITIWAATGNRRSRAIPERLGFRLEGVEREAELRRGDFFDLARYALLSHEWAP